jgi:hypothetical protein
MRQVIALTISTMILLCCHVYAATIVSNSCSLQDVQSAINSAKDGDTIMIPAGRCSWNDYIEVNSKYSRTKMLKIIGAGSGNDPSRNTIIVANNSLNQDWGYGGYPVFVFWLHRNLTGLRVSNIRFVQNVPVGEEEIWAFEIVGHADAYASLFRVDHCFFQYRTGEFSNAVHVGSLNGVDTDGNNDIGHPYIWGLFDHNTFDGSVSFQTVDVLPIYDVHGTRDYDYIGNGGWRDYPNSEHSGTWKNVFYEDNIFTSSSAIDSQAALDGNGGAALVIRDNYFSNNWINGHGADSGDRSIKWFEVYNNTLIRNASSGAYFGSGVNVRGGTGVMFGNRFYDGDHKGNGNPYGISGTDVFHNGVSMQYYRAFSIDRGGDGICADAHCGQDPKLGCDNNDQADGWICRDQPGVARGPDMAGWAYGYKWQIEPLVFWDNYWANTDELADITVFDDESASYVKDGRDFLKEGSCGQGDSCTAFWENGKRKGYIPYTYPHPLTLSDSSGCGNGICDSGETCTTCSQDCKKGPADNNPCDNCINTPELNTYINQWLSGSIQIASMMDAIKSWKAGC